MMEAYVWMFGWGVGRRGLEVVVGVGRSGVLGGVDEAVLDCLLAVFLDGQVMLMA